MAKTTAACTVCLGSKYNPSKYYVSQEERNFYSENGYLILRKFFDQQTLDSFRQRFTEICDGKALVQNFGIVKDKKLANSNSNPADYIYKVQNILSDPVFMRYSEEPRLMHIASQFLGAEELTALNCMIINKPSASSRHPSHQDAYYFPIRPVTLLACWTAIDPATVDNGCLYVVPGSHKLDILPHEVFQDSKKFFHCIENEAQLAPENKRVYLEMSPGDTVIFHSHIIHGSGANKSKRHRKSMTVHYMDSGCEFVDLTGTAQESIVKDFKENVQKNGFPESYEAVFKFRSKKIKGVRSNL